MEDDSVKIWAESNYTKPPAAHQGQGTHTAGCWVQASEAKWLGCIRQPTETGPEALLWESGAGVLFWVVSLDDKKMKKWQRTELYIQTLQLCDTVRE